MSVYIAIDMKSFYASVECVSRGLDPMAARLLVADESRSDSTICLAVSPALKQIGVPGRPRLFEAKRVISDFEQRHNRLISYIVAPPRMAEYEAVSASIYGIYQQFAAPEDIHVYSIDESFIDCTPYLRSYEKKARECGTTPIYMMASHISKAVFEQTGIPSSIGIGTNLYLAKVAMDLLSKHANTDPNGIRIAQLDEASYKQRLWAHRPLTDFWMIGHGTASRLNSAGMSTMGQIAERSLWDEEWFYRCFGINAEILIDHAWGLEPVTLQDIKQYVPKKRSLTNGQVLMRPYSFSETRLIFSEMIDAICTDLWKQQLVSERFGWYASYDTASLELIPDYKGALRADHYGRIHPSPVSKSVRLRTPTNDYFEILPALLTSFDQHVDQTLLFRRLSVNADPLPEEKQFAQFSLFDHADHKHRSAQLQKALLAIRMKYGINSIFRCSNLLPHSTALERGEQIGGHRA